MAHAHGQISLDYSSLTPWERQKRSGSFGVKVFNPHIVYVEKKDSIYAISLIDLTLWIIVAEGGVLESSRLFYLYKTISCITLQLNVPVMSRDGGVKLGFFRQNLPKIIGLCISPSKNGYPAQYVIDSLIFKAILVVPVTVLEFLFIMLPGLLPRPF
ncbi:hypothetical protein [Sulfitobacter sp. 1A13679]|uniref:hypothetical protein n=1 Tax=Sulfitobacter sp. 1A13679 TaxID=3368597 RepID=UPI003745A3C3